MIELVTENESLVVRADDGDLRPRDQSQLVYWGFQHEPRTGKFVAADSDLTTVAAKLVAYFEKHDLHVAIQPSVRILIQQQEQARAALKSAVERCSDLKNGVVDEETVKQFAAFLDASISRPLKDHQFKAALHLITAENGANFSVPGSGKTTVVLAAFSWLKNLGFVDSLFVVGPPACFAPWKTEYGLVLGQPPEYEILAGGDIDGRRSRYLVNCDSARDLYLTTFQTLQRDWALVRRLFEQGGVRFFLVIDEAHYIKQLEGAWASSVLNVSKHAARRCILTGTPFPRSYTDAFNLFDALWPNNSPITPDQRHRIELHSQRKEHSKAAEILDATIGPLFYRVRKDELHLGLQHFHDPIRVSMSKHERLIYDSILDRVRFASESDFFRDFDLLVRLRRGRMIRLRQCTSYAALVASAVTQYSENLFADDPSLADVIRHYDELESPAKVGVLLSLVSQLRNRGEKVVVWSNFVGTLKLIVDRLQESGHGVRLIYGGTPFENMNVDEEFSREKIIREFIDPVSGIDVLIANPAACAESISLHTTCSHAIYYDLSYNCAQYLQSLDRIHRVGGSEYKAAHYYVLQYEDSIDQDILLNVRKKASNMSAIIDQDYPLYSLDMFDDDDELQAYERLFGKHD
jgi:SNF2-related domain/Helicase conserved C-terminal domain